MKNALKKKHCFTSVLNFVYLGLGILVGFVALSQSGTANEFVRFDFNLSTPQHDQSSIFIELYDDRPITRDNFLAYVDRGKYDGAFFHRLAKLATNQELFVLQGGGFYRHVKGGKLLSDWRVDLDGKSATPNPSIQNEFSNSPNRSNVAGTIAMAKLGGNPNSATNQFFFNLNDNSSNLDNQNGGFTVFGGVVGNGMRLIYQMAALPTKNLGGPFNSIPLLNNDLIGIVKAGRVKYYGNATTTAVNTTPLRIQRYSFVAAGAAFTGTKDVIIETGNELGLEHGANLNLTVQNQGVLAIGLNFGKATVKEYHQASSGELQLTIRGQTVGTQYDKLDVSTTAVLDGKLSVKMLTGFSPGRNSSFEILKATGGLSGEFSEIKLPKIADGLVWRVNYGSNAVTLTSVTGDYNHDGVVNAADFTVWRDSTGNSVVAGTGADGNADGVINQGDFFVWKSNFGLKNGSNSGSGSSVSSTQVPEPSSLLLAVLGSTLVFWVKKKRS